jgi:hypothetical protein
MIVPSRAIPLSETEKWRRDKDGSLPKLRVGHRCWYRLSDWQSFLNRAAKAPPVPVPWAQPKSQENP